MNTHTKRFLCGTAVALLGSVMGVGCSGGGSGSSGSGGGGGLGSLASGLSSAGFGQFVPAQARPYAEAGGTAIQAFTMSDEQEDQLGRAVTIAATNRWPLYDNPELTKYVTMVGLAIASTSPNPDGNWVFGVLDTPELGAYSGPNGYIMVTRGALAAMQDEAELAGVIAHEIAHSLNHDGLETVKAAKKTEALKQVGTSFIKDPYLAGFARNTDFLNKVILNTGWNQGQENAADARAVELLVAAGYDPNGLTRFLQRLQTAKGGSAKPFSTHPGTAERISRVTSAIHGRNTGATNAARFAKAKADAKL
jgi:predicted Zn-dependent protease